MLNIHQKSPDNKCARFVSNSIINRINNFFKNNNNAQEFIEMLNDDLVVFGSIIFSYSKRSDLDILINSKSRNSVLNTMRLVSLLINNGYKLVETSNTYDNLKDLDVIEFENEHTLKSIDIISIYEKPTSFLKKNSDLKICSAVFNGYFIETEQFTETNGFINSAVYSKYEFLDMNKLSNPSFDIPKKIHRIIKYVNRGFTFRYMNYEIRKNPDGEDTNELFNYILNLIDDYLDTTRESSEES